MSPALPRTIEAATPKAINSTGGRIGVFSTGAVSFGLIVANPAAVAAADIPKAMSRHAVNCQIECDAVAQRKALAAINSVLEDRVMTAEEVVYFDAESRAAFVPLTAGQTRILPSRNR